MVNLKLHTKIALAYFLIAAILGVALRSFTLIEIQASYKFIVHTHSHIALLGWVYLALTSLLYKLYLGDSGLDKKYRNLFWFTQLTLMGMLVTFPFQGYALFSIIFSTLFLFASYWFVWFFLKNISIAIKKTNSYKCMRAALWYLVASSLGPWVLGVIMNTLGAESVWYRLAIYFYLHFQYNGWMLLVLVGSFFYVMEQMRVAVSDKVFKRFFWSFNLGILLSFFLSTLFAQPSLFLNVLGGAGALLQLLAFGILVKAVTDIWEKLASLSPSFPRGLLITTTILLAVKMILQLLTAIPYFADLAATILDFTIGYLHWTFLGVIIIGLFFFLDYFKLLKITRRAYLLYFVGFLAMEALIFYKGIVAWQGFELFPRYFEVLAMVSLSIPLSLIWIFGGNLSNR